MKTISKKMKRLVWWRFWYLLKFRKTYETKIFQHHGNTAKLKIFLTALGDDGWQIVNIEKGQERIGGGNLTDYHNIIVQREHHVGVAQLTGTFNIANSTDNNNNILEL